MTIGGGNGSGDGGHGIDFAGPRRGLAVIQIVREYPDIPVFRDSDIERTFEGA